MAMRGAEDWRPGRYVAPLAAIRQQIAVETIVLNSVDVDTA